MNKNLVISLDVGTTETAFTVVDENYVPLDKGKIDNYDLLDVIYKYKDSCDTLVYEEFASYGMPIGKSTMESIKWNGRFIQHAIHSGYKNIFPILRKDVKINLCGSMKAKDGNIRQALIDRFGEVGVKNNQGWFYGFKSDLWSAYGLAVTHLDKQKEIENE